jgi:hypothetical protein
MDVSQCRNLEGSAWGNGGPRVGRMASTASTASVSSSSTDNPPAVPAGGAGVNGDVPMSGMSAGAFLEDLSDGGRVKFVGVADGRFRGA